MSCSTVEPGPTGAFSSSAASGDGPRSGHDDLVHELLGSASVFASVVTTVVNEALARVSGEHALSLGQLRFLELISHGDDANVTEIARSVQISSAAVSRNLDKLVDRGLVGRHPGTDDRRTVRLSLTGAGNAVLKEYRARIAASLVRYLGAESPESLRDITGALDRMTHSLLEARTAEPPPCRGCIACNLFRRAGCLLGADRPHAACHSDFVTAPEAADRNPASGNHA